MVTHETVRRLLAQTLQMEPPGPDDDLLALLDSLAFVELLLALEQECALELTTSDLAFENFRSINNIVEFVNAVSEPTGLSARSA